MIVAPKPDVRAPQDVRYGGRRRTEFGLRLAVAEPSRGCFAASNV